MRVKTKLPGYYTVDEASQVLGKTTDMVYWYIRRKQLSAIRIGRELLIEQTNVHDFHPNPRGNPNFRKRNAG